MGSSLELISADVKKIGGIARGKSQKMMNVLTRQKLLSIEILSEYTADTDQLRAEECTSLLHKKHNFKKNPCKLKN